MVMVTNVCIIQVDCSYVVQTLRVSDVLLYCISLLKKMLVHV